MKRRKHRLVVELTVSQPVTEKRACQALTILLNRIDLQCRPVIFPGIYADKLNRAKEFSRVMRAENAKRKSPEDLLKAIQRADRLISWMAKSIGQMAPGKYQTCYSELNEHFLFIQRLGGGNEPKPE